MQRFVSFLGAGLLALTVVACGSGASPAPSGPVPSLAANSPRIVAKDIKFMTTTATAPANAPFAMDFDNQDSVPHNVSISSSGGQNVFKGDIFSGAGHRIYAVPALAAGTYTFKCDVHPEMTGTLTVS
jgi:plastocyanin